MTATPTGPGRHLEHDAVASELASWFTTSSPAAGYHVTEEWFGYLGRFDALPGARFIPRLREAGALAEALSELSHLGEPVTVFLDDRSLAARFEEQLVVAGYAPSAATTHLALVGEMEGEPGPAGLRIEVVGPTALAEWAEVKLKAFGDSEELPAPEAIEREMTVRTAEAELTSWKLARLGTEPVAVLAHYTGRDQVVFNLATRLPYRHQNIAQALLSAWVGEGRRAGCRSLVINAHEGGRPEALYRRLGFVDEVHWYKTYSASIS